MRCTAGVSPDLERHISENGTILDYIAMTELVEFIGQCTETKPLQEAMRVLENALNTYGQDRSVRDVIGDFFESIEDQGLSAKIDPYLGNRSRRILSSWHSNKPSKGPLMLHNYTGFDRKATEVLFNGPVQHQASKLIREILWCKPFKDKYIVDTIPFYSKEVAIKDEIRARKDPDSEFLILDRVIEHMGHSTVWFTLNKPDYADEAMYLGALDQIRELGCTVVRRTLPVHGGEVVKYNLHAIDVPAYVPHSNVMNILLPGKEMRLWGVEEGFIFGEERKD